MTMRFVARLTKVANIPPHIIYWLIESDDTKLTYFHFFCCWKQKTLQTLGELDAGGYISYADFSIYDITSKSIQSFVNIPQHILQDMRELYLEWMGAHVICWPRQ